MSLLRAARPLHQGQRASGLVAAQRRLRKTTRQLATTPHVAPGAAEAEVQAARRYCDDLLSKYDRPSYTLSTFIPPTTRPFYIALRALNVSLSTIPDTTTNYTIGLMRLQFWREAISKTLSGSPPKEPVTLLLASSLDDLRQRSNGHARIGISKGWFTRMINARERTLTNDPYPNIAAIESYAESTYSTLLYLTLSALPMASMTADHLASHIGKAAGIAAVLKGLPLVAFPSSSAAVSDGRNQPAQAHGGGGGGGGVRQGAVMLPLDVMAQMGVKEENVFRLGAEAPGLRDAVFAVATRANDHLITVRQMLANLRAGRDVGHEFEHLDEEGHVYDGSGSGFGFGSVGGQEQESPLDEVYRAFGVLMPAVATQLWLDKLEKVDFDIFRPELLRSDWRLPWRAYWAFQRKTL